MEKNQKKKLKIENLFIKNYAISYEQVMSMSDDEYVKISTIYFSKLMMKYQASGMENKELLNILNENLIYEQSNSNFFKLLGGTRYFLISVKDIKTLMLGLKDKPINEVAFLECKKEKVKVKKK